MKINEIEIKHFRGFPGPSQYSFKLDGKNLLLYGENGSGKSSLYHALNQFFNIDNYAPPFNANIFAKDKNGNEITDGYISVHLDNVPPTTLIWSQNGIRPTDPILTDTAMRKGFLEYRSLLRTNFATSEKDNLNERLFNLAVKVLLAQIPVSLSGIPMVLDDYWQAVRNPKTHHKCNLDRCVNAIDRFNEAFKAILPDIERQTTAFLDYFVDHNMKLKLEFQDLTYEKAKRNIQNQELHLRVEFNNQSIPEYHTLLNEARLSSLALALFLASVKLSNPTPGPSVSSPLRLLVLDDVLIGLDLCNRLPLLDILEQEFKDYQIILLTYDRVWFELASLRMGDNWVCEEHYSERIGNPGYEIPVIQHGGKYIEKARYHFDHHDYRAAAVYTRAAFKNKLKNFCNRKLPVQYFEDQRQMTSKDLWEAVIGKHSGNNKCHVDIPTKTNIESLRKVVLNPLSHDDANSITKVEVEAAIKAIETLSLK
jgi:hypothetical protein